MESRNSILDRLRDFMLKRGEAYGISRLGLFGSYARNEQTKESDIDICIRMNNAGLFKFAAVQHELESIFNKPVDLVSLGSIMLPNFKNSLEKDAIFV